MEAVRAKSVFDIINSNHAGELGTHIYNKTNKRISTSTLVRMFVNNQNQHIPYLNTLDILSDYAGFTNWSTFCKSRQIEPEINIKDNYVPDKMGLRLLKICLDNHEFKSVLDYLKLLEGRCSPDSKPQLKIGEIIGLSMRVDIEARKLLIPEMVQFPQGRFFFFESFVDEDNLDGYYGDALLAYQKFHFNLFENQKFQDSVFSNTLLFWKAVLQKDKAKIRRIGYALFSINEQSISINNNLHAHPVGRWLAYRLVYWKYSNQLTSLKIAHTITLVENELVQSIIEQKRIILAWIMEVFVLLELHREVIYLFKKYKFQISKSSMEFESYQIILICVKTAFLKSDKRALADQINLLDLTVNSSLKNKIGLLAYNLYQFEASQL